MFCEEENEKCNPEDLIHLKCQSGKCLPDGRCVPVAPKLKVIDFGLSGFANYPLNKPRGTKIFLPTGYGGPILPGTYGVDIYTLAILLFSMISEEWMVNFSEAAKKDYEDLDEFHDDYTEPLWDAIQQKDYSFTFEYQGESFSKTLLLEQLMKEKFGNSFGNSSITITRLDRQHLDFKFKGEDHSILTRFNIVRLLKKWLGPEKSKLLDKVEDKTPPTTVFEVGFEEEWTLSKDALDLVRTYRDVFKLAFDVLEKGAKGEGIEVTCQQMMNAYNGLPQPMLRRQWNQERW